MVMTIRYGTGKEMAFPIPPEVAQRLEAASVSEALQAALEDAPHGFEDRPILEQALADPLSVIERWALRISSAIRSSTAAPLGTK